MARLGSVPDPVCRLSQTPQEDVFSISVSPENVHSFAVLQPQENNQAGWSLILLAPPHKVLHANARPDQQVGWGCVHFHPKLSGPIGRQDGAFLWPLMNKFRLDCTDTLYILQQDNGKT